MKPKIYFYYPDKKIDGSSIPESSDVYLDRKHGNYIWTVKTYCLLKNTGYDCHLTDTLPENGIVLTHRDFLDNTIKPNSKLLIVCLVADTYRHPYAQLHLLQNPKDPLMSNSSTLWPSDFVPHWTESGFIPRDRSRGDKFENIAYVGGAPRLAPQFRKKFWREKLKNNGLNWIIVDPDKWNDYSQIDAIVAIRSISRAPFYKNPATKLYNAWKAGTPAIMGSESSCQAEKKSDLDFIEVNSVSEAFSALQRLKNDISFRNSMVENGHTRAKESEPDETVKKWINYLDNVAIPAYEHWASKTEIDQNKFISSRKRSYLKFLFWEYSQRIYWIIVKKLYSFKTS